jgi:hypothetical protein
LGVGSLLTFDFRGPLHGPNAPKAVSPLIPFDFLILALALQKPSTSAIGNLPFT